jgi:hypothetical protein
MIDRTPEQPESTVRACGVRRLCSWSVAEKKFPISAEFSKTTAAQITLSMYRGFGAEDLGQIKRRAGGVSSVRRAWSAILGWFKSREDEDTASASAAPPSAADHIAEEVSRADEQANNDPVVPLTAAACGKAGAYYFSSEPTWVVRHVETLEMRGLRSATRHLTIDLALPTAREAIVASVGDRSLYCIPIARLSKDKPTVFIDLRDEHGGALPLLTREENARISSLALASAVRTTARMTNDEKLPPQVTLAAGALELAPRPRSDYWASYLAAAIAGFARTKGVDVPSRIGQVLTQLAENSYLWSVIEGRPGDRRVLKLHYTIELDFPKLPVQASRKILLDFGDLKIPTEVKGEIMVAETLAVLRAYVAARIGWDSIDLKLPDPVIQDPRTYHLQIDPPRGLRVDRIEFAPAPTDPPIDRTAVFAEKEHLYLRPARIERAVPLSISMRVDRRGFLNLSMLSSAIICALLWVYQASAYRIAHGTDHEAAAAVLLVVPALLVVFATRPTEHPLASMLLSGIRTVMLTLGLVAGAAAAAIADIRPTHTLSASLIIYAVLGSACSGVVTIAYLDAIPWVRRIAERARRWWCSASHSRPRHFVEVAAIAGSVALVDFLARARLIGAYKHATRIGLVLVALAGLAAFESLRRLTRAPEQPRIPAGVRLLALVTAIVAIVSADPGGPHVLALDGSVVWVVDRWIAVGIAAWALFTWAALWLAPLELVPGGTLQAEASETEPDSQDQSAASHPSAEAPQSPASDPPNREESGLSADGRADEPQPRSRQQEMTQHGGAATN